jgi:response regulator of citrate/malate metabolism
MVQGGIMEKHYVLVSGSTIYKDSEIVNEILGVNVITNRYRSRIETIIDNNIVDLILLEVTNKGSPEVEIIKSVSRKHPDIDIILLGSKEALAKTLSGGVKDAFRTHYRKDMIVERVSALLGKSKSAVGS